MFLVLGNVAIDEVMATRHLPSPGQTVLVDPPRRDLGGKGANQAIVLARCGVPLRFIATIGDDDNGRWIAAALSREHLALDELVRVPAATDRSLIFVDPGGENSIASSSHCSDLLSPAHALPAIATSAAGDILLAQGGVGTDTLRAAFPAARANGLRIVFNPSAMRDGFAGLIPLADLVVLNAHEAADLVGDGPPAQMLARLRSGNQTLVITLGKHGAIGGTADATFIAPAAPASVRDTTGAGDTYLAVLAASLYQFDRPLKRAMRDAASAAAITISRDGTLGAFPTRSELAAIFAAT